MQLSGRVHTSMQEALDSIADTFPPSAEKKETEKQTGHSSVWCWGFAGRGMETILHLPSGRCSRTAGELATIFLCGPLLSLLRWGEDIFGE